MTRRGISRLFLHTCLFLTAVMANAQVFTSSKLPILKINTSGKQILDDQKIVADLHVIDQVGATNKVADLPTFSTRIGIEWRGQTSLGLSEKKPYSVELREADGFEDKPAPLLGMAKEADWAFLAPYSDKTLIREALTYTLAREMLDWAPDFRFVELTLNDAYQGLYMVTEKVKRDKNRVDIDKMEDTDNVGDELTGGYIFSLDKVSAGNNVFYSKVNYSGNSRAPYYVVNYPRSDKITLPQNDYIRNYVMGFENLMRSNLFTDSAQGYRNAIDVPAFIDFFLINELTRNVDGYRLSTFFKKDKSSVNSKLGIAGVWDYNIALGNSDYCGGNLTSGWAFDFNNVCSNDYWLLPTWMTRLAADAAFRSKMKTRWHILRKEVFESSRINRSIDSLTNDIGEDALNRNFQRFKILNTPVWPNAYVGGTHAKEIIYLKNWLRDRIKWLDGQFGYVSNSSEPEPAPKVTHLLYPNPAQNSISMTLDSNYEHFEVYDFFGRLMPEVTLEFKQNQEVQLHIETLPPGAYVLKVFYRKEATTQKFVKQ